MRRFTSARSHAIGPASATKPIQSATIRHALPRLPAVRAGFRSRRLGHAFGERTANRVGAFDADHALIGGDRFATQSGLPGLQPIHRPAIPE